MAKLPPADRREFLDLGRHRMHPADTTLIRQGDPAGDVYLLIDALVKVTATVENGAQTLLAIRLSGDLVGEMAVLDNTARFATVTTCRRSLISHIPGPVFLAHLDARPATALTLNRMFSSRLRYANQRRLDIGGYPVAVRLGRVLLELAELHGTRTGECASVGVTLTQAEYAALIGAAPDSVNRAMRQLAGLGYLDSRSRPVKITKYTELATFSDIST
ncbi:Crp/Fnr family transcriptional regulator [Nonomuraea typhae]|uniref:Crp/Fnr family transcriptional regulator n=1 Tax=Nonomuraea typhae TaxID=2603600 RepID=UPI0015E23219|nr:Crp/Fnr family transcriptional regulator [Nonomuraea typhae]